MKRWAWLLLAACGGGGGKEDAGVVAEAAKPKDAAVVAPVIDAPPAVAATAVKLVAGAESFCAVMSDRSLRCWGDNTHGELGNGKTAPAATVTPDVHGAVDVVMAGATTCALLDDGSVSCWGWIGGADSPAPQPVSGVTRAQRLFVMPGRACATFATGALVCWGEVDAKGHPAAGAARGPTTVIGLTHVAAMTPAGAVLEDGTLWVWNADGVPRRVDLGSDKAKVMSPDVARGELPRVVLGELPAKPESRPSIPDPKPKPAEPVKRGRVVPPPPPPPDPPAATVCVLVEGGVVRCVGGEAASCTPVMEPPKPPPKSPKGKPPPPPVDALPPAAYHSAVVKLPPASTLEMHAGTCAIATKTKAVACGSACGQKPTVQPPKLDKKAQALQVAGACVLLADHTVTCGGAAVDGATHARTVAMTGPLACALLEDGTVTCWGPNRETLPQRL